MSLTPHVDVLIIGAGLSGIGAARHLQRDLPAKSFAILESRGAIGGTWDLFRYPGVRSDSDMYTLGYKFKPWREQKSIADGAAIRSYVREAATETGVEKHIRFHHRVISMDWSSDESRWDLTVLKTDTEETVHMTASYVMSCSGYYRYDEGFTPEFAGRDSFSGQVVHPQFWPEDLDYAGKRVVIIGSGATAVTLAPNMATTAEHVTLLQRSPTYIVGKPAKDATALKIQKYLPGRLAASVNRFRAIVVSVGFYVLCQKYPTFMKSKIAALQKSWLPEGYDLEPNFTPRYNPWDQRLCLVPDNDLFAAIRKGTVSMVTDTIDTFTENGIRLASGQEIDADIVVTATGLNLLAFGGIEFRVDGREIDITDTMAYKGVMLSGIPNFSFVMGYTNASWTLKADMVCDYVCRLLKHMDKNGHTKVVVEKNISVKEEPFLDFAAGYVLRSVNDFPSQGSEAPWNLRMNYFRDLPTFKYGKLVDSAMSFDSGGTSHMSQTRVATTD